MPDMILMIIEVCFVSLIMRFAAGFCIDRAKIERNQIRKAMWTFFALIIIAIAFIIAMILLWKFIASILF